MCWCDREMMVYRYGMCKQELVCDADKIDVESAIT